LSQPEKQEDKEWQKVVVYRDEEETPGLLHQEDGHGVPLELLLLLFIPNFDGQLQELAHGIFSGAQILFDILDRV